MKAIMYHYVREYSDSLPNFRYLDIENFSKQLDFFEKEFGFMEKKDWDDVINRKVEDINSFKDKIILTFDDAMKCHYEYVYPELEKRGLWGIFYVNSLSAHSDYLDTIEWLRSATTKPKFVILNHGEEAGSIHLKTLIESELDINTTVADFGESFELDNIFINE